MRVEERDIKDRALTGNGQLLSLNVYDLRRLVSDWTHKPAVEFLRGIGEHVGMLPETLSDFLPDLAGLPLAQWQATDWQWASELYIIADAFGEELTGYLLGSDYEEHWPFALVLEFHNLLARQRGLPKPSLVKFVSLEKAFGFPPLLAQAVYSPAAPFPPVSPSPGLPSRDNFIRLPLAEDALTHLVHTAEKDLYAAAAQADDPEEAESYLHSACSLAALAISQGVPLFYELNGALHEREKE